MSTSHHDKIKRLRERKLEQTKEKMRLLGPRDEDDYGCVPPPEDFHWKPEEEGEIQGAQAWGKTFRSLMENHPLYIDADDALAGRWMFMLSRMRKNYSPEYTPFPLDYSHLREEQERYGIISGIGHDAHFAPDYRIGLKLGWKGLLDKVEAMRKAHEGDKEAEELLDAEAEALHGIRSWIRRTADLAAAMSIAEEDAERKRNLEELGAMNHKLVDAPPTSLREACQWLAWFNMASRTYNRDGAGGQLDIILQPYYERDLGAGAISKDEAIFFLACLLLNDPHYYQLGGPDRGGRDQTNELSFLILEAAHLLKISCNLTIRVHEGMHEKLFQRGMEILFEDQLGYPRFSGDQALVEGFMKNGFDAGTARERIALGCSWMSLPGREYAMNDLVKVNMAKVFEVAQREMFAKGPRSTERLMEKFRNHLRRAVKCTAEGIRFHLDHQYKNEPELLLNLLSHGPIEKGRDASHGGMEYYNMCIDGAGLAVVADSFAAIEQRIEIEKSLTWEALEEALTGNFTGTEGQATRALLTHSDRYGQGRSLGDKYAEEITRYFSQQVKDMETGDGVNFLPGLFSWADTVRLGKTVGATPNGRAAGAPISHGANPNPGFRKDGALTAIVKAVAGVQPGFGNTAPLQLEIDPGTVASSKACSVIGQLLKSHFSLGGTLANINIIDKKKLLDAHEHPEKYPDLLVRVTGFSAYFATLSRPFRQLVVDRIIGTN